MFLRQMSCCAFGNGRSDPHGFWIGGHKAYASAINEERDKEISRLLEKLENASDEQQRDALRAEIDQVKQAAHNRHKESWRMIF